MTGKFRRSYMDHFRTDPVELRHTNETYTTSCTNVATPTKSLSRLFYWIVQFKTHRQQDSHFSNTLLQTHNSTRSDAVVSAIGSQLSSISQPKSTLSYTSHLFGWKFAPDILPDATKFSGEDLPDLICREATIGKACGTGAQDRTISFYRSESHQTWMIWNDVTKPIKIKTIIQPSSYQLTMHAQ